MTLRKNGPVLLVVAESPIVTTAPCLRFHDVASADSTRLRAWTNDADGPRVLLCNGLGTNPQSWPALLTPDCGVNVVSWNHRGVGGSQRPPDGRVDLDAYVEDALAVMDDAGLASAVVASWSAGVTVAFELAHRHPERVDGILAVAGVPGDTFSTMLAPWHVPTVLSRPLMVSLARATTVLGHLEAPLVRRFPWTPTTTRLLQRTGAIGRDADPAHVQAMVTEFCSTHPAWYARLALGVAEHGRVSLSGIDVPTTFVAGRRDLLTSAASMRSAADRVTGSRFLQLDATHFIPLEHPDVVHEELLALLDRVGSAEPCAPHGGGS
ncbi:alpha/beta fold hydrolase [Aeromicrobium sp. CTD01-1L150]|uniref:alpha/beta fold hydrolase n=1 Tax=Aeromicrobium sp. CTD01-1L150 TaxID=3341830 RepID=UPI0035C0F9DE